MKKHIEDLRNALYKHDLTVAVEEDTPAFPAVWTLAHPYFTPPKPNTIRPSEKESYAHHLPGMV
ncbi:Uncharacterised protein [Eikenella corrodens]|uniref:Uncharacterized protein n=2 Tax=Eikenella corrodens TaxID=539 RepID=C0DRW6_EIKCO|nr:hypothetical protein [Eikenella corrodens]EEG25263.1 hypothetical protein EIKCOROL_00082 [Eikenella corrodens ATCC 23834]UAK76110.1 hypothetical protein K8P00_06855 [Eikenella corrodens]SNW10359.1 Uncharacterised protein [Eikenella corrodens]